MLSVFQTARPARGNTVSRREVLRAGGLSCLGLTLPGLAGLRDVAAQHRSGQAKLRHNSCVFIFLFGGPSQIDLWDMKPLAPAEIRGEFRPIASRIPGVPVCEHLPRLAEHMDKVCLVRSMTHEMNVHGPACSELLSGRPYFGAPITDQASPEDWPSLSSLAMRYGEARPGLPSSVVLPWYLQFPGQSRRIAGQSGGRMGERYNGMLLDGDSDNFRFRTEGLQLQQTVPLGRLKSRRDLLAQFQKAQPSYQFSGVPRQSLDRHREQAFSLLEQRAADWLDIEREPASTRDRYGRTMVGQSLLMARRLLEGGVSLITVNWEDETKIDGVNTCWDTHQNNFSKLKETLCPIFDQAFPTFLADLDQRGLLDTTLVVAVGEFGRTPYMGQFTQSANTQKSGRDHWPSAFTALLAGGGVRGGQVYGATDRHSAFVSDNPVSPGDLSATILHHLGIDPAQQYQDEIQGIRYRLSDGRPLVQLG